MKSPHSTRPAGKSPWTILILILLMGLLTLVYFALQGGSSDPETPAPVVPMEVTTDEDSLAKLMPDSTAQKGAGPAIDSEIVEQLAPKKEITTTSKVLPPKEKKTKEKTHKKVEPEVKTKPEIKDTPKEEEGSVQGRIKIISSPPFASLHVNGSPWGETPMKAFRDVPPGEVRLKLSHRMFPSLDTVIVIKGGEEREVLIKFKKTGN